MDIDLSHIKATKEGKLIVKSSTLFSTDKIQSLLKTATNSSIAKSIKENQKKSTGE